MNNIYNSFVKSIGESSEIAISNCLELGLDALMEDSSIFKEIPFLSTAIAVYKIGHTVSEMHHIQQLSRFIDEINKGISDSEKIEKYKTKFQNKNEKEKNKELEYIILISSKYLDENKPRWLARIYIAYLDGIIDWQYFTSFSEVIDRFLPGDMETLMFGEYRDIENEKEKDSLLRLLSLGIYRTEFKSVSATNTPGTIRIPSANAKDYLLTEFGRKLKMCLNFSREETMRGLIESLKNGRK